MKFFEIISPYIPIVKVMLIGALIGYFTNWLAIKMLFRPRRAYYIGKHKLPLTPGLIPRNKTRLAEAISNAIVSELLTKEDIQDVLRNGKIKEKVFSKIEDFIYKDGSSLTSLDFICENKDKIVSKFSLSFSSYLVTEFSKQDIAKLVKSVIENSSLSSIVNNPMLRMIISPDTIYTKISQGINQFLQTGAKDKLYTIISPKVESLLVNPISKNLESLSISKQNIASFCDFVFDKFILENVSSVLDLIDTKKIIYDKIDSMDVLTLEKLVLSVMNKELNAIVNLGLLLGACFGLLNLVKF